MTYKMQYIKNRRKMIAISLIGIILFCSMFLLSYGFNYKTVSTNTDVKTNASGVIDSTK